MRSASFSGVRVHDIRASQRQSFAGRISHRVVSGLSFASPSFPEARSGTVIGTTINTLCSVIGAGVLSLPLALYYSSVLVGLGLLFFLVSCAAFSVYLLVVGCDATGRYSITEVVAFALYPPQLWEEYLYLKGTEHSSSYQYREGGDHNRSDHNHNSSSHSAQDVTPAVAAASKSSRSARTHGTQPQTSTSPHMNKDAVAVEGAQDEPNHHYRSNWRSQNGPINAASLGNSDNADHIASPSTSAYTGLRDAYARQEWHHRRCRRIVTVLMEFVVFCSNYGTLVIYSKVIADSMPPVMSYVTRSDGFVVSKYFWLTAGGVVFFVLSCARNMEELKWSSLLGFLTIFYVALVILFRYHTQRISDYPHVDASDYGSIHWLRFSVKMLQTVSTFGLAFSYHYNVPYFYKELQDRRPRRMIQTVAIAFPIIIACYAMTGVFGYLTFGNEVANKKVGGNIVSNYPKNDLPMNIGRLGLFAHFACVFPVVSICTRRGLHRLMMIALTWVEQSALMREAAVAAGAILTNEEAAHARAAAAAGEGNAEVTPGETSPLLLHTNINVSAPTGYENFTSSLAQHHQQQSTSVLASVAPTATATYPPISPTTAGEGGTPACSSLTLPNSTKNMDDAQDVQGDVPATVDVDRDVGSPDLTTTLAIVVEAAFLVLTAVLIAATVSGIDFVIHIIGTLFSVFIVMVAPGMVGWCVFSPNGPFGSATAAAAAYSAQRQYGDDDISSVRSSNVAVNDSASRYRFIRLKQAMSIVNVVLGCFITCVGIAVLAYDSAKGLHAPSV